ncbi:hypothetical protein K435DRAFT_964164 [Dendrothele bispora CBS 962.96]|uniref:Uncharacterized protein n=1 Tax=Dendrothele bispora (strain CBS 962.96) TaxID=1314807 RepID=A0A4S8MDJ8_DENBC|nr:hypothetical protein K435DRAFT_964164 [Dendrothele bispora CBS 962.96]
MLTLHLVSLPVSLLKVKSQLNCLKLMTQSSSIKKQESIEFLANLNVSLSGVSTFNWSEQRKYKLPPGLQTTSSMKQRLHHHHHHHQNHTGTATRDDLFGDGGSMFSGSSGSHCSRGGGGNYSPKDSFAGSGRGTGNEGRPGFPEGEGIVMQHSLHLQHIWNGLALENFASSFYGSSDSKGEGALDTGEAI